MRHEYHDMNYNDNLMDADILTRIDLLLAPNSKNATSVAKERHETAFTSTQE